MSESPEISVTPSNKIVISERDVDFVQMTVDGGTRQDIAKKWGISKRTVEQRFCDLQKMVAVKNTVGLVAVFFRNNLVK
jgi:DNA-binding NarL/FixJ family response regulator